MRTLIKNGLLMDPANGILARRNLLAEDGKIAAVTEGFPPADRVIDAEGCVVCPGFIDIHMHEDPVVNGRIEANIFNAMLRMGVTTCVGGNCGMTVHDPLEYLDIVDRFGAPVNVALFAGHEYYRNRAGAMDKYAPVNQSQLRDMVRDISAALDGGCVGLSFGLRYVPGTTRDELLACASCCEGAKRLISAHVRDDAAYIFDAIDEIVEPARRFSLPVQISHIGSMAGFGQMAEVLRRMDAWRADGLDIAADCYPYFAFSTRIGETTYDDGWLERYNCDYSAIRLTEGKYAGQTCTAETFAEMRRDDPDCITVCGVMREEDVRLALSHPLVMPGSDGLLDGNAGHPRAAGTFPRFLTEFCGRGEDALYEGIRKITALPANRLGLAAKGRLNAGADADIAIFNPRILRDRATFDAPTLPPEGMEYVLLAGKIALRGNEILKNNLGKSIRF